MAKEFAIPLDTPVTACSYVQKGSGILHVIRDGENGWQFLCGEGHGPEHNDPATPMKLGELVERDPSLLDIADLAPHEGALRHTKRHPWVRHDGYEDLILESIEEHGWHGVLVPDDAEGPGFAYSIGQEPEILVFGLEPEVMHAVLNACAEATEIKPDVPLSGFLPGFSVVFRAVDKAHYPAYLGYAMWYHEGSDFPALQCVWPDDAGKFPWEPAFQKELRPLQPDTWSPAPSRQGR